MAFRCRRLLRTLGPGMARSAGSGQVVGGEFVVKDAAPTAHRPGRPLARSLPQRSPVASAEALQAKEEEAWARAAARQRFAKHEL